MIHQVAGTSKEVGLCVQMAVRTGDCIFGANAAEMLGCWLFQCLCCFQWSWESGRCGLSCMKEKGALVGFWAELVCIATVWTGEVAFQLGPCFHFDRGVTVLWASPGTCIHRINVIKMEKCKKCIAKAGLTYKTQWPISFWRLENFWPFYSNEKGLLIIM